MNTSVASITTVKEALEAAKKYLWDGTGTCPDNEGQYICHCIAIAIADSKDDIDMWHCNVWNTDALAIESVEYVEGVLHKCGASFADSLGVHRGVIASRRDKEACQAFRLAFIDELIAGLADAGLE